MKDHSACWHSKTDRKIAMPNDMMASSDDHTTLFMYKFGKLWSSKIRDQVAHLCAFMKKMTKIGICHQTSQNLQKRSSSNW